MHAAFSLAVGSISRKLFPPALRRRREQSIERRQFEFQILSTL